MHLKRFKTLWGHTDSFQTACKQALVAGFDGIEGQAPASHTLRTEWQSHLQDHNLSYIAEVVTGGDYVPDRSHTPAQHLDDLKQGLDRSLSLHPLFITCLAGCDAWDEAQSIDFFSQAMEIAQSYNVTLSFETHRSRPTFNPWSTLRIANALPDMRFTADISHWCVVCERLMDSELHLLKPWLAQVHHLHARVGYAQGPQVPDPRAPEYQAAVDSHLHFWQQVWQTSFQKGKTDITMTPEFGPDDYCHLQPYTQMPVADLWELNQWMGTTVKNTFDRIFFSDPANSVQ